MPLDNTSNDQYIIDGKTGLKIVPSRDNNLTEFSKTLLKDFYLREGESPQQGYARASLAWSAGDLLLAQRLYDAVSKGWFMFASPVLSNAPLPGENIKGLPISCFLSYVPDSLEGLIDHSTETRWLSVKGGGVGGHWSNVRSVSDKAPGPIPFIHTIDSDMEAYKQGKVRRGSYAAYMDINHPDILEFLNLRVPTGDASRKCHSAGFHHGVNVTDEFMNAVEKDLQWPLKDPHTAKTKEIISARMLWEQLLEVRYRTGEPYIYFIDAAKRALPESQKALGLTTHGSNLCLVGDTLISIEFEGNKEETRLDNFVEKYSFGFYATGVKVKSFNIDTNEIVWTEISNAAQTNNVDELIRIEYNDHVIECTPQHKILTKSRGWIKAQDLLETDDLVL